MKLTDLGPQKIQYKHASLSDYVLVTGGFPWVGWAYSSWFKIITFALTTPKPLNQINEYILETNFSWF